MIAFRGVTATIEIGSHNYYYFSKLCIFPVHFMKWDNRLSRASYHTPFVTKFMRTMDVCKINLIFFLTIIKNKKLLEVLSLSLF